MKSETVASSTVHTLVLSSLPTQNAITKLTDQRESFPDFPVGLDWSLLDNLSSLCLFNDFSF